MDKLESTSLGGIAETWNDERWYLGQAGNQGIYPALNNILGSFGTNFVVQGCILSGTSPVVAMTEGWIYLGGELLKVDAAAGINTAVNFTFTKVVTNDSSGLKQLQSGATANTYKQNRGVLSGGAGALNVLTGDRYKDQFDEWKTFDITGNNTNLVANASDDGSGLDIVLGLEVQGTSHLRYKIVGKTVMWSIRLDSFDLSPHDTAPQLSIVIRNLPWTAKVKQSQSIHLLETSQEGAITNTSLVTQDASSTRMYINQRVFGNGTTILNRFYTWLTTPSMTENPNLTTGATTTWIIAGNGSFEIE